MDIQTHSKSQNKLDSSFEDFKYFEEDGVAIITLDMFESKVNTLSSRLIPQFESLFQRIEDNDEIKAIIIISGKKDCFVAGADIKELQSAKSKNEVRNQPHL